MKRSILFLAFLISALAISVSFVSVDANAQVQKPILRAPVSGDNTKEALISSVELPPGFTLPRHTHPGDDYTVVLQGSLELNVEGREPKRVSAGEAFYVPTGVVHYTRVLGDAPVHLLAIWLIEKGKPAMQPISK